MTACPSYFSLENNILRISPIAAMEVEGRPLSVDRAKHSYLSGEIGDIAFRYSCVWVPGGWPGSRGHLGHGLFHLLPESLTRCPFHCPEP